MNSGQVCAAGSRLFVHERVFDQVWSEGVVSARARGLELGAGTDAATDLGPVVSDVQRQRVTGYIRAPASRTARGVLHRRRRGARDLRILRAADGARRRPRRA